MFNLALSKTIKPSTFVSLNRGGLFHTSAKTLNSSGNTEDLSKNDAKSNEEFFKYHWGHWLKNDAEEKAKRFTPFSVNGLVDVLNDLRTQTKAAVSSTDAGIPKPFFNPNLTVNLKQNLNKDLFILDDIKSKLSLKSMESYHEGKHHHIYKITTTEDKDFILRIPYPRDSEHAIATRLRSEVATRDFADLVLKIKTPKVYAYSPTKLSPIKSPFILEEFVEGDLAMKNWNPMIEDTPVDPSTKEHFDNTISQLMGFQSKLASIEFKKFGSLYFANELPTELRTASDYENEIYVGEKGSEFEGRYKIGYTTERSFWRQGKDDILGFEEHRKFLGPWKNASDVLTTYTSLELAVAKAKKASEAEIEVYNKLHLLSKSMIQDKNVNIPGWDALLKPRLQHPDIDPMNCIETPAGLCLVDFENSAINPFILNHAPEFIAYDGPKVYTMETDNEEFKKPGVAEQYMFAYKRTRNLFLWEQALNKEQPELIYSAAPIIKLLKSPIIVAKNKKLVKDYLLINEKIVGVHGAWPMIHEQKIVAEKEAPVKFTGKEIEEITNAINAYNEELIKEPFAATQNWIPSDMYDEFVKQGIIKKEKDANGDSILDFARLGF
ncbi:hypothetical protein ACO0OE_002019 [Hanseniaspora uvarum]